MEARKPLWDLSRIASLTALDVQGTSTYGRDIRKRNFLYWIEKDEGAATRPFPHTLMFIQSTGRATSPVVNREDETMPNSNHGQERKRTSIQPST